jgi:serine/threonine-protein kinase
VVKLTDFGLAKSLGDRGLTGGDAATGTVYYMSPEQVRNQATDARSDLYSLGCVLYEVATGRKPFEAGNSFSIMQAHVEQEPVPPSRIDPSIPASLERAILKAMAKQPLDRFQSARDFRTALEEGRRVLLRRPRRAARAVYPSPVRVSRVGVAAVAALTVVVGTAMWSASESGPKPETARLTAPIQPEPVAPPPVAPPPVEGGEPFVLPLTLPVVEPGPVPETPAIPQEPTVKPAPRPHPPVTARVRRFETPSQSRTLSASARPSPAAPLPAPPSLPPEAMTLPALDITAAPGAPDEEGELPNQAAPPAKRPGHLVKRFFGRIWKTIH